MLVHEKRLSRTPFTKLYQSSIRVVEFKMILRSYLYFMYYLFF